MRTNHARLKNHPPTRFMLENGQGYQNKLTTFGRFLGLSSEDAKDAYQETFCNLSKHRNSYDSSRHKSIENFISRVYMNACLSIQRLNRLREKASPIFVEKRYGEIPSKKTTTDPKNPAPIDILIKQEEISELNLHIRYLSPIHRDILNLHYFQHMTYKQIATQKNIPIGTVKTRLHNATKKLKKALLE